MKIMKLLSSSGSILSSSGLTRGSHDTSGDPRVKPEGNRLLWIISIIALVGTLGLEFTIHPYEVFGLEATPFFHAWYGFATSIGLLAISKILAPFLKRPDEFRENK